MSQLVHYAVRDRVAVITIDHPPVNALAPGVLEGIVAATTRAGLDPDVVASVVIGAGATFMAGADLNMFRSLATHEESIARSEAAHTLLRRLEDAHKPVVAAIHGHALGGGLETAMACHYRVALSTARLGQPEVQLGLIPGAGGTQRLPRLCGVELALEMCTSGRPLSASHARRAGILDFVVDADLLDAAIAFALARAASDGPRPTRYRHEALSDREAARTACEVARTSLQRSSRGARAPVAAVEAIEAAVTMDFEQGLARERALFAECVLSSESRACIHLFFAEREVSRIPDVSRTTPVIDIRRAAVVGAGTMGAGIAMTYANAGIPVYLRDVSQSALTRAMTVVRQTYDGSVGKGKLSRVAADRAFGLIMPTQTFDGFDSVDIVVEAVFEDMAIKKATFGELAKVTRFDCVLASNTSTLDIDEFAAASGRATQVVGHHFFSPAHVMKLLEIVRGAETSPSVIATSLALARRLGKIGAVVGNCFGFVGNRMLAYYMREAYLLLEEGASVSEIDGALTAFGLPVGPFAMQDIAGIDVGARIRQHLAAEGRTRADGPQSVVPDRVYELGRYGQKTGSGWYRYESGSRTPIADPLIDELATEAARARGVTRRTIGADEIIARIMTALANEGARILEEGYALRASDIDVIYAHGFGFPRHRGGPMFYADTIGLATVLERVKTYRDRFGDYWTPAPLLEHLVQQGRGFVTAGTA